MASTRRRHQSSLPTPSSAHDARCASTSARLGCGEQLAQHPVGVGTGNALEDARGQHGVEALLGQPSAALGRNRDGSARESDAPSGPTSAPPSMPVTKSVCARPSAATGRPLTTDRSGPRQGRLRRLVRAQHGRETRARRLAREHLEAGLVRAALEVVPDIGQRVLVVGVGLGERVPGLLVQGRVVQALGPPLDIFEVARVPVAVQLAPQARHLGRLLGERALGAVAPRPRRGSTRAASSRSRSASPRCRARRWRDSRGRPAGRSNRSAGSAR